MNMLKQENENDEGNQLPEDISCLPLKDQVPSNAEHVGNKENFSSPDTNADDKATAKHEEQGLVKELEASSKGKVQGSLFLNYFKTANGPLTVIFLVITFLSTQILASFADIWFAYW